MLFRKRLSFLLIILLWVIGYLPIITKGEFVDERDNWVGAYLLTQGYSLYQGIVSHHGPLAYFLALPAVVVAHDEFVLQRYVLMAFHLLCLMIILSHAPLKERKLVTFNGFLLILLSTTIQTYLFLAESFVTSILIAWSYLLYFYYVYEALSAPALIGYSLLAFWLVFWLVPTFVPALGCSIAILWWCLKQKKDASRKNIHYHHFLLAGSLGAILPGYLLIHGLFRDYVWSVFTFNATYYYQTHVSQLAQTKVPLWQLTLVKPFTYLHSFTLAAATLHLTLIKTIKNILVNARLVDMPALVKVGFTWWWERLRPLDMYVFHLFSLSWGVVLLKKRSLGAYVFPGVCLFLFIVGLRLRDTSNFHLAPFYGVSLSLATIIARNAWGSRKRWIAWILPVAFTGFVIELCPAYFAAVKAHTRLIPTSIKDQSVLLNQRYQPSSKLLNLSGDMTYYITTSYLPAAPLIFYRPWFDAVPHLRLMAQTALASQAADVVVTDNDVFEYAPHLTSYLSSNYQLLAPHLYQIHPNVIKTDGKR